MATNSGLWAIAVSNDEKEGDEVTGKEGIIHTVPNNGFSKLELCEFNKVPSNMLLPGECFWGMSRGGRQGNKPAGKMMNFHPVTAIIDAEFVPFAGLIDNLLGAEKMNARVHWKFFGLGNVDRSGSGTSNLHHQFTLTGTHGWITAISYAMGQDDSFTISMSATGMDWRQYSQAGSLIQSVRSAAHDEQDAKSSWVTWM